MTFKVREISKVIDTVVDFNIKNLVVSGCSFTYNNHNESPCTWPYYLRDLGNFDRVLDCSLPGAGNFHIFHSLQWALELEPIDPSDTLIIVMWSGNNRDDYILPQAVINDYPMQYHYLPSVMAGLNGGTGNGNILEKNLENSISSLKNNESRSVENFLYINAAWHYLRSKNYRFCFLNYANNCDIPLDFNIILPPTLKKQYNNMFLNSTPLYNYCVMNNQLSDDQFHPTSDGHLHWTKNILIPSLSNVLTMT